MKDAQFEAATQAVCVKLLYVCRIVAMRWATVSWVLWLYDLTQMAVQ
jgi:hypothetical protein